MINQLIAKYGLSINKILPYQTGYRNRSYPLVTATGQGLNLILYKSEPGILAKIRNAHRVAAVAATHGLPVRTQADPRIAELTHTRKLHPSPQSYAALYHYLPGTTIPWEAYTQDHIKLAGLAMSHMHAALRNLAPKNLPSVTTEYLTILDRITAYFTRPEVTQAIQSKLNLSLNRHYFTQARKLLQASAALSHQQPLHMDFVRGNLLFGPAAQHPDAKLILGSTALTGIIDFEKTALGHPVFDAARTLAFLIVDCPSKTEAEIHKHFLHSGYNKRGPAHLAPSRLLGELINFFLLHDLYKFLRHNPYEALHQNHHYLRTRDILLTRGIIAKL